MAAKKKVAKKKAAVDIDALNRDPVMLGGPPIGTDHDPEAGLDRVRRRKGLAPLAKVEPLAESAERRQRKRRDEAAGGLVKDLDGVSAAQAKKLAALGYVTVADLQSLDLSDVDSLGISKAAANAVVEVIG